MELFFGLDTSSRQTLAGLTIALGTVRIVCVWSSTPYTSDTEDIRTEGRRVGHETVVPLNEGTNASRYRYSSTT
ncbi:hypothetical protein HSB1_26870 [Halogranum salarium B-1]|uniref:Uncharacterized protein n=1 Tax=Halogranum salarium B-1 TaxID=1210908 RepID=J3JFJ0_9EURY|nr:hypothetical protein HSB1_26870 [Halogranum salarium B-1]